MKRTGRKLTRHSARVFVASLKLPGTFDEEDVCSRLQGRVSRATVFRQLGWMVEVGVLRRVEFNGREVLVVTAEDDPHG